MTTREVSAPTGRVFVIDGFRIPEVTIETGYPHDYGQYCECVVCCDPGELGEPPLHYENGKATHYAGGKPATCPDCGAEA